MSKKLTRPKDTNQLAKMMVDIATGQIPETDVKVYMIFDTELNQYVSGINHDKRTWSTSGAAKNVALRVVNSVNQKEWLRLYRTLSDKDPNGKTYFETKIRYFKDQSRFEIHEMQLTFLRKCK